VDLQYLLWRKGDVYGSGGFNEREGEVTKGVHDASTRFRGSERLRLNGSIGDMASCGNVDLNDDVLLESLQLRPAKTLPTPVIVPDRLEDHFVGKYYRVRHFQLPAGELRISLLIYVFNALLDPAGAEHHEATTSGEIDVALVSANALVGNTPSHCSNGDAQDCRDDEVVW